ARGGGGGGAGGRWYSRSRPSSGERAEATAGGGGRMRRGTSGGPRKSCANARRGTPRRRSRGGRTGAYPQIREERPDESDARIGGARPMQMHGNSGARHYGVMVTGTRTISSIVPSRGLSSYTSTMPMMSLGGGLNVAVMLY